MLSPNIVTLLITFWELKISDIKKEDCLTGNPNSYRWLFELFLTCPDYYIFILEPGYYQDGVFGIRIEDLVQIVPAESKYDFNGRGALTFKTITVCPKQTKMIKKELLLDEEVCNCNICINM